MEGPSIVIAKEELKKFEKKKPLKVEAYTEVLREKVSGRKFLGATSWGKHLIVHFTKLNLRIHFLMFGSYRIDAPREGRIPKLKLIFENGVLYFYSCAIREISKAELNDYKWDVDLMSGVWSSKKALASLKSKPNKMVCDLLMDQSIFSGLGNIMKNEILFRLRMHPETKIQDLTSARLKKLVKEAEIYAWQFYDWKKENVLKRNWKIFRKKKCPECGGTVNKKPTGSLKRISHFAFFIKKRINGINTEIADHSFLWDDPYMNSISHPLVAWTSHGLYCKAGGFYIDPHRAVDLAIVTHAHSDHARRGSRKYICVTSGVDLLKTRLGKNIVVEDYAYREEFQLGDVIVSLHSAGHILGSAQVRIQRGHEVWVASGDYKRDRDPSCEPFESVKCDTFITEATFGTPKYTWPKNLEHGEMIYDWWMDAREKGKNCLLFGYSLGKAQRILAELAPLAPQPVLIHSTITQLTECYRQQGRKLAATVELQEKINHLIFDQKLEGELILAPPSILKEKWSFHLGNYETAFASGWMQGSASGFSRGGYDKGFVMSDHADWNDLNQTIEETGARRVFVQHRNGVLVRHLKQKGLEAYPVEDLIPERYFETGGINLRLI